MRAVLTIVFLAAIFTGTAYCADLKDTRLYFHEGNRYYKEGRYAEAAASYRKVLKLGFESGEIYYNLGNVYFKEGFLGKAIVNYLRARRVMPRDADLISNLAYARTRIKGGVITPQGNWFIRAFLSLAELFTLNSIALFGAILYLILSVLIISIVVTKRFKRIFGYFSLVLSALLIISILMFSVQFYRTIIQKEAIVIVQSADYKFEPLDEATTFFSLNEGETVVVVVEEKDWVKVRLPDGKQGWLRIKDIEKV